MATGGANTASLSFPCTKYPFILNRCSLRCRQRASFPSLPTPERYGAVVENPNLVLEWLKAGCLIQVNSGSVLGGRFGPQIRETSEIMLTHNMVQFVASDAHGLTRRGA